MPKVTHLSPEQLLNHWQRPIYNLALRRLGNEADAADVTQDIFVRVFDRLHQLRSADQIRGWIYRIAHNAISKFLYRKSLRVEGEKTVARPDEEPESGEVERRELARLVQETLRALPEGPQSAINLRFFEGLTHQEIGAALDMPRTTVQSQIKRGLDLLRRRLGSCGALMLIPDLEALMKSSAPKSVPAGLKTALAALPAGASSSATLAITGGLLVKTKTFIAAALGIGILSFGGGVILSQNSELFGPRVAKNEAWDKLGDQKAATPIALGELERRKDELSKREAALAKTKERLTSLEDELVARGQERVAKKGEEAELAATNKQLNDKVAALEKELEALKAESAPNTEIFRFGLGNRKTPSFDSADWPTLSKNMNELAKVLPEVVKSVAAGKPPPPALMARVQKYNMPLATFAIKAAGDFEDSNPNASFTHPAVVANIIRSTLDGAGDPLSKGQEIGIEALGEAWAQGWEQEQASFTERTPALTKVAADVDAKLRFLGAISSTLTATQQSILFDQANSGRVGVDLLSPGLVYVRRVPLQATTIEELKTKMLDTLLATAGVEVLDKGEFNYIVEQWLAASPFAQKPLARTDLDLNFPHINNLQAAVKLQVAATEQIIGVGSLKPEQVAALRGVGSAIYPQLVAPPPAAEAPAPPK